jgi:hypothetical protein
VNPSASFGVLRQFVRRSKPRETCELCSLELGPTHQHLLEPVARKLVCACDACAILFSSQGPAEHKRVKYKRVPRRIRFLSDFRLTDGQWAGLMMPINMAFFFQSTPQRRVIALYPSPAGATESLLSFDSWSDIEHDNPALLEMEPDVEALLVNRIGHSRGFTNPEYYLVPIDECFKLVGLIRARWQGLSGGTEVWKDIGQFFSDLQNRSEIVAGRSEIVEASPHA